MQIVQRLASAGLALLAALPGPAAPNEVVQLEPVVIVGSLLTDSPATVSVVDLEALPPGEATTAGLAAGTANFFVAGNGADSYTDIFALRGLTNTPIFGDPAVSFYLDGLPLGSGFTFPSDLSGFARAELHRGPTQNTVFGRAGSAGVVTLTTPEPGPVDHEQLQAGLGNFGARHAAASVTSTAAGPVDGYLSVASAARDGYITNTQLARDVDHQEATTAVARVRYRPAPVVELTLLVTARRIRDGAQPLVPLDGPKFTVGRGSEGRTDLDAYNAAFAMGYATPVGRLTATTSVNDWALGPYVNTLNLGRADLVDYVSQKQRAWNEEIKLVSAPAAAVHWQGGIFLSSGTTDGAYRRTFGPYPYESSSFHLPARSLAAFGEATLMVTRTLSLTAGLRLEDSRKSMHRIETVPVRQVFDLRDESTALLPKIGLAYAPDHATSFFATAGAGFKPGGFSAFTGIRQLAAFGPERTETGEIGVTRTSVAHHLAATFRAFYYDITGYQIERSFATNSGGNEYLDVNAPHARSFGAECELRWEPTVGWIVAADVGYTNVTLREFVDPFTGVNYAGRRAPAVPVYNASLRTDYRGANGVFVGADLTLVGRTYYTEGEDLAFGQRSYGLLGVQAGYQHGAYRVTLYGRNVSNAAYFSAITPGINHGTPGAPRTCGIEASTRF